MMSAAVKLDFFCMSEYFKILEFHPRILLYFLEKNYVLQTVGNAGVKFECWKILEIFVRIAVVLAENHVLQAVNRLVLQVITKCQC